MKLVFFNRFFFPDTSATSQILSDLAFHLAGKGFEVHVVASGRSDRDSSERVRGVTVHRVAPARIDAPGLAGRAAAYFLYYRGARRAARRLLRKGDVAIAKTDPPLLSAALARIVLGRDARFVVWLQDLFPEIAAEYGVPGLRGPLKTYLAHLRDESLRRAHAIVAVGGLMRSLVAERARVPAAKLHVVHNWADGRAVVPMPALANGLRRQWRLEGFVVAYSGNLGRVHEFETILEAAARLRAEPGVVFLFVGGGAHLGQVRARVEREALTNVRFEQHQPRDALGALLAVADVHLVVLKPCFEGLSVPSKLYGILAAGRPAIFVGDTAGEVASILARADAGCSVATGDAQGLAAAVLRLRDDASRRARLGANARRVFEREFDMPIALAKWEAILAAARP